MDDRAAANVTIIVTAGQDTDHTGGRPLIVPSTEPITVHEIATHGDLMVITLTLRARSIHVHTAHKPA